MPGPFCWPAGKECPHFLFDYPALANLYNHLLDYLAHYAVNPPIYDFAETLPFRRPFPNYGTLRGISKTPGSAGCQMAFEAILAKLDPPAPRSPAPSASQVPLTY
jgi:hypothetical protein